jgi:hypothetical protein
LAIQVELLDFLHTGNFGGITLGITRQQIIDLVGNPPEWHVRGRGRKKRFEAASIWKYGSMEFFFAENSGAFHMIYTDHFPLEGCETLTIIDPWLLRGGLTLDDALTLIKPTNLSYQLAPEPTTGDMYLTFASGVEISFTPNDQTGSLELSSFLLSADRILTRLNKV